MASGPRQLQLLDVRLSMAARDRGMGLVRRNNEWAIRATTAARQLAEARTTFTTDDLWQLIEKPPEPRAIGPILSDLQRSGVIVADGYQMTAQVSAHRRPIRIWRSLIARG